MFRLKQKHSQKQQTRLPAADGRRLLAEQSVRRAILGGMGAAFVLCWGWALLSMMTSNVFPWMTILIGALIGMAVQRFGRGLDWRFPVIAVVIAGVAAYGGNLMIGVLETGRYIEAETVRVIGGLSMDTMRNFFRNTINPIDHIYAFSACGVAAFFANRRLRAIRRRADDQKPRVDKR